MDIVQMSAPIFYVEESEELRLSKRIRTWKDEEGGRRREYGAGRKNRMEGDGTIQVLIKVL